MQLRAKVRQVLGTCRHVTQSGVLPPPAYLEIVEETGVGFFLFYFAADGTPQTDTWHRSVDDAKHQAAFEFAIETSDWETLG